MIRIISKNLHWVLLLLVVINLVSGLKHFTNSTEGIIAFIFGIVGLLGITYLVILLERKKRRGKKNAE